MSHRSLTCFALLLASGVAFAQTPFGSAGAPAQNWETKIFTKEGYRSMILRGTEARVLGGKRLDVVDLSITTFSKGADAQVDSILLSPVASFFSGDNLAKGDQSVRLIRIGEDNNIDMEITGEQWTYIHDERKITIQKKTRVVFHAELPDLLQ